MSDSATPWNCNPPGLQDYRKPHGIPQARILEYSSSGDLLNPGIELMATAWKEVSLPLSQPFERLLNFTEPIIYRKCTLYSTLSCELDAKVYAEHFIGS